jgi:peptidoglycan/xylan/chitin deacetylase (PgdA/CDA1 family)
LLDTLFAKHGSSYFAAKDYIPYEKIPEHLINAVVCTEDPNFWAHHGIDPAFVGYAIATNLKSNRFERGASTITMQLVRNLFLNHDKNILRKAEECVIALLIENHFKIKKTDILELYLNLIEFAPNVYGLHNACQFYFGKPYNGLTLTECLALTYIIPRPKHFYEALPEKSEQLKKNLHLHIQQYANVMLRKKHITSDDFNNISNTVAFSSRFETLQLPDFMRYTKKVALTIDDLPFVSVHNPVKLEEGVKITNMLLHHLQQHNVKATGFVTGSMVDVEGEYDDRLNLLRQWQADGHVLANHSYAHLALSKMSFADFEKDIAKNEKVLSQIMEADPVSSRYFRFPYLDYGNTLEMSNKAINFLHGHSYTIVPVTIDAKDYMYDVLYTNAWHHNDIETMQRITDEYLAYFQTVVKYREQQALHFFNRPLSQIVLIHANRINACCLDKIIELFEQKGYEFVSLQEALKEPVYQHGSAVINTNKYLSWKTQTNDEKSVQVTYPNVVSTIFEAYKQCLITS